MSSPGRTRRATTKKVDYAKEQEFSDAEDLFEEEEDVVKPKRGRPSRGNDTGTRRKTQHQQNNVEEEEVFESQQVVYTEKGYDPSLPPIRERFPFLPEYEEDGSPKIELIVGRRPIDEKEDLTDQIDKEEEQSDNDDDDKPRTRRKRGSSPAPKGGKKDKKVAKNDESPKKKSDSEVVEYEYLVKFKGKSYLHLEWKTGADLESMNKSAKGIYRRYIKKLAVVTDDDFESPEVDPSFVVPEKILDEADQEVTIEMTDKELLKWEKQREKEMAAEGDDDEDVAQKKDESSAMPEEKKEEGAGSESDHPEDEWPDEIEFKNFDIDHLRRILKKETPYYPVVKGSDNAYRDGYVTEPPKKPRASYLFFQCTVRTYFQKKNPNAIQSELMGMLGEAWRGMDDDDKIPFQILANEETKQYEREKALLEKAQKPNGVWQPLRRCMEVLNRMAGDSFADIFLEPVDVEDYPDYEELIDVPMDLGTVRKRLENRKYQAPEQFARDMRRIWNNCKIFNQHGTAIWHVADYMSKQFERLYHAWVLEFRERYLRWADPRARPWEHSCRCHDGKCGTSDDKMVLCDHCDGTYGIECLTPPLKKIPSKAWHCPECKPKIKSTKGSRMLSAVAENAARKRAELGDIPKKQATQTMFLVKWAGLGYEFCSWETKEDIGRDDLISAFHEVSKGYSDEADMPEEVIDKFLESVKHVNNANSGGIGVYPELHSQLYAQSRGLQFLKFGIELPEKVGCEMGPKSTAVQRISPMSCEINDSETTWTQHPREVVECITNLVFRTARNQARQSIRSDTTLAQTLTGEYDAIIPITAKGLMMNVGEIHGSVAFLGYRQFPDGSKGPAEISNLIQNVGDKIIAVDGVSTIGKSFKDVINLLRESGKNKFAYMRFLETRFSVCEGDLASVGAKGLYAVEELQKKFRSDRQRLVMQRKAQVLDDEQATVVEDDDDESAKKVESDEDSEAGSEGSFEPDSDDEELIESSAAKAVSPSTKDGFAKLENDEEGPSTKLPSEVSESLAVGESLEVEKNGKVGSAAVGSLPAEVAMIDEPPQGVLFREETTRSLGLRLLDVDLGYSSDEAGDEDCVYYLDGVDGTFTNVNELEEYAPNKSKGKDKKKDQEPVSDEALIPASKSEFSSLGDRGKLAVAVALSAKAPFVDDFEHFPEVPEKEEETAEVSPIKSTKLSTVKVEQVSVANGETIHIWANVEAVAATLQLPLPALKQVLLGEYDEEIGEEVGGFKWRYALAGSKVTAGNASTSRGGGGKKAKEAWLEFRDKLYDPSEPHSYKNGNRLRDYQVDGVNWLASTWYKRQGCILADEMGLGKTVQIVCYIEHIFRVEKIHRPFLVVVPLSTVEHWRREFEGWTDMVCCVYHDRQRVWRDVMREYEWYYEDKPHTAEFLKFDVLVTTYDTLIGDFDVISQIPFRVAVVDEAHRLRNQKGKLLECMREISARGTMQYGYQSRVLMSGTPLQNDLTELWTLLNFIEPFKFPDIDSFQAAFGNMANRSQVESLQQIISPFMLRRVKEDVAKDIPAKEETVIDVELTSIQKQYYRAIFEHNHAFLNIGATRNSAPKLMNIQMELRKVCNHPFLLDGVEHRETDRQFKEYLESGAFDGKTPEGQQKMLSEHGYISMSGKMVLLDKLLPKLRQEGHKILIFSQMVKMLDLISEYCEFRNFNYERLDGRVRGSDRQKSIDRFEREPDSFLFLLSTRAGGVGINLTAADVCIIFDSDWNPQNDVQAQARCHRIGQTKDVRIYRLVTSRSFEQEMFDRASRKLGLEQAVLGTFEKDQDADKPTQQEMERLLKKGAYALLDDDNDDVTKEFCTDDIESILKKRTRTRVVEGTKTASWLNKAGMVVSKSKFTSETGDNIDMDDPLFWQKVMPGFVTPSILLQKLRELEDEIDGRVRGPGRGRGRWRKKKEEEAAESNEVTTNGQSEMNGDIKPAAALKENGDTKFVSDADTLQSTEALDAIPGGEEGTVSRAEPPGEEQMEGEDPVDEKAEEPEDDEDDEDDEEEEEEKAVKKLSRTSLQKINKFVSDLKSMMESMFDEEEDEGLSSEERDACQSLLLTMSVKDKMFNDEQRHVAKKYLKRFEGDRRRRCRTSEQPRFQPGAEDDAPAAGIRAELMITGKKRKKRRKRSEIEADEELAAKRKRRSSDNSGGYVGEDGYLHHTDSEGDWSDVAQNSKKDNISRKEANRRRNWGAGDDAATAAGRAWPVFPRGLVKKVLSTVLERVLKYDEEKGGVFSVPVPKDEFPEYYEQIKKPMDYSTMKSKLENGGYRSAQSMQKDFILIMQNCRRFNADSSDIVREAREQHLMRPKFLKEAAAKHDLFLAEDGSVLEIVDEKSKSPKKKVKKKAKKETEEEEEAPIPKKKKGKKKTKDDDDGADEGSKKRIRIKLKSGDDAVDEHEDDGDAKSKKRPVKRKRGADAGSADESVEAEAPIPKKKRKNKSEGQTLKKSEGDSEDDAPLKDVASRKTRTESQGDGSVEDAPASIFLDLPFWIKCRENLDDTYKAARKNLCQRDGWEFPPTLPDDKFADVAIYTLDKMTKKDKYSIFAEAVSDKEAPGYSDVVKFPMDFGTMLEKVKNGAYGVGSDAANALFKDFKQVFDNCYLYNDEGNEVTEEATRILGYLPETYVAGCVHVAKKESK